MIQFLGSVSQDLFAFLAVVSSILVITSKNPVISVLFLISVFVNSAIYLMITGLSFVGISYIIIYVGAIAILFLFILMMINIKLTDILEIGSDYTKNLPLAFIIGALFIFAIFGMVTNFNIFDTSLFTSIIESFNSGLYNITSTVKAIPMTNTLIEPISDWLNKDLGASSYLNNPYYLSLTVLPLAIDAKLISFTQIEALGHNLYTHSALLLIITSFILLLSMLAPIILSSSYTANGVKGQRTT